MAARSPRSREDFDRDERDGLGLVRHDDAEIGNGVADRVRREMFRDIGLAYLLCPRTNG